MIASRPLPFSAARTLGEEIRIRAEGFYLSAPSGAPSDLQFTTDEQSHLRVPLIPNCVYRFPAGFTSLWIFSSLTNAATDAAIVFSTGADELAPQNPVTPGAVGSLKAQNGTATAAGVTSASNLPTAGKRFRVLGFALSIPGDSTLTTAGEVSCGFQLTIGGVATIIAAPLVAVPGVAGAAASLLQSSYNVPAMGFLADVNTRLSSVLAGLNGGVLPFLTGGVRWEMLYTEE